MRDNFLEIMLCSIIIKSSDDLKLFRKEVKHHKQLVKFTQILKKGLSWLRYEYINFYIIIRKTLFFTNLCKIEV